MLKYALVSALLLVFGQSAIADEPIKKSEVKQVVFYENMTIQFDLKDGSKYRGQIITPDCSKGRKYFEGKKYIHDNYKLVHMNGFKTCRFSDLERIA